MLKLTYEIFCDLHVLNAKTGEFIDTPKPGDNDCILRRSSIIIVWLVGDYVVLSIPENVVNIIIVQFARFLVLKIQN